MRRLFTNRVLFLVVLLLIISCTTKKGDFFGKTSITKWQKDKVAAVSLTFDDGTINQFTVARPIMNKLNFPGTFYIITGKVSGSVKGKFIGRSYSEIIEESVLVKTDATNFFERASAIGFIGGGKAIEYHSNSGALFESGKLDEAYDLIDQGYEKIRKGEIKIPNEAVFHNNTVVDTTTWEDFKTYTREGHEIASHTVAHPRLAVLDEVNMLYELGQSKADIHKFLGEEYTFSAECPYGTEDERVMDYAYNIYPSLRNRMPEPYLDELNRGSVVDPRSLHKEYVQWQRGALTNTSMDRMKSWVDTSIDRDNIWLVLVFHGVNSIGWEPKTGDELEEYFNYIKEKEKQLWIATFADVSKYIKERMNAIISSKINDDLIEINISSHLNSKIYNIPLTVKTYVPESWKTIRIKYRNANKNSIILKPLQDELGNYILYDVLPYGDNILISDSNLARDN
jgi:peptidoglycan/xylan/chitin deacetylase (PgdA/CDA1 family)